MDRPNGEPNTDAELRSLRERLHVLESRIAALEGALAGGGAASASHAQARAEPGEAAAPPVPPGTSLEPPPAPVAASPATTWQAAVAQPGWGAEPVPGTPAVATPPPGWGPTIDAPPRLPARDLVDRYAGRLLAWTGGLALVAAAVFLLSLAFSRGWIGVEGRVLIGLGVGVAAFVAGGLMLMRGSDVLGRVLTAIGLGIYAVAVMAATRLYGLVPPPVGLAAALVASIAAAALAIRTDARSIAAFGLVTGLVAPPLTGASPDLLTLLFVAVTLVGTTAVALYRSWSWLPPLAFLLAAPQLAVWLADASEVAPALIALLLFWLVNVIAAAGEEVRVRRDALRAAGAIVVVANAVFLAWGLATVLDGALRPWLGVSYVMAAAAHALVGAWFLARQGPGHGFGTLTVAVGAGFLAIAAVAQLDAATVPAAWALEAAVLTWVAVRRDYPPAAWMAAVLGGLSILHLVAIVYPFWNPGLLPGAPFDHAATISLAVVVGALLASAWLVPVGWVRGSLAALAVLVAAWAGPFEVAGTWLVAWLACLAIAGVGLQAIVERLPVRATVAIPELPSMPGMPLPRVGPSDVAGALAWLGAAAVAVGGLLDPARIANGAVPPAVPFSDEAAIQGALLVLGAVLPAAITSSSLVRVTSLLAGFAAAAWLAPFEVGPDLVVVLWAGIAALAWLFASGERTYGRVLEWAAVGLGTLAVVLAIAVVAPPTRLVVSQSPVTPLPPAWPLSFAAVALLLVGAAHVATRPAWRAGLLLGAASTVTYAASVGVVAAFQGAAGGDVGNEELAKQAQVALSVLWTALGVVALVGGLVTQRELARDAGLALLALATAKVFLVDLAALDVAYRVLSLAALGVLLLASAWLVIRFRGPRPSAPHADGGGPPG
jgi:uncharacterized membrane protein